MKVKGHRAIAHVSMLTKIMDRRCAFVVKKRGRQCRMTASKGSVYCGEHLIYDDQLVNADSATPARRRRIPCPLDPSHTIFEDTLNKHLKKCNAGPNKKPMPTCYSANINSGLVDYQPSFEDSLPLSSFPDERIKELTQRVEVAYKAHFRDFQTQILYHPALSKELSDPLNGPSALKHLRQQSSILGHLDALNLLSAQNTCYIEFGAGRGKLSGCIQKSFETRSDLYAKLTEEVVSQSMDEKELDPECCDDCKPSPDKRPRYDSVATSNVHFLLVDKASCRRKVDGSNKVANLRGIQYHRLLMDIEHLDLSKFEYLSDVSDLNIDQVVAVSKHLCGAATDLSLRCLVQTLSKKEESKDDKSPKLRGILVALCCHHRCKWSQLVGREFFERLGFSPTDFHLICHMSSWAVCGVRPPKRSNDEKISNTETDSTLNNSSPKASASGEPMKKGILVKETATDSDRISSDDTNYAAASGASVSAIKGERVGGGVSMKWGYVAHPNESIGLKCKHLIDLARLSYLEENGFNAHLVYYVETSTSLENVLLVAKPKI